MIIHNLKIALRNLAKYKLQTLVSIVALAVGIVTLAATHFVMKHTEFPSITKEPYYDQCYVMRFYSLQRDDISEEEDSKLYSPIINRLKVSLEMETALAADGGLPGVENTIRNSGLTGITRGSSMTFTMPDSTTRTLANTYYLVQDDALNFFAIPSAITGEKIPILKDGEVVISELVAKKVYGEKNPIGCKVSMWINGEWKSVTIRDVYKAEQLRDNVTTDLYVHYKEPFEDYVTGLCLLLADGQSPEQVRKEADRRLEHLGIKTEIISLKEELDDVFAYLSIARTIVYLISSLILLAALIGFLKIQLQQFGMRRREVSLRRVHGANKSSILYLLLTELIIIILMALVIAFLFGAILINYSNLYLTPYLDEFGWKIEGVYQTMLFITAGVIVICSVAVWTSVSGLLHSRQTIAAQIHRNRKHTLRNSMLALQLFVSILFLSGTLALSQLIGLLKEQMNIPSNDDFYAQCISVRPANYETDSRELIKYLQTDAKEIKQYITISEDYSQLEELMNSKEAKQVFLNTFFLTLQVKDTTILDFWQRPIKWFLPPEKRNNCMLLCDSLYSRLRRLGVTDKGSLLVRSRNAFPIGGTFSTLPYIDYNSSLRRDLIIELGADTENATQVIVVPEDGKYSSVFSELEDVMHRINPQPVNPTVMNLRKELTTEFFFLQNIELGAWLLSAICFVICFMGIWSSISLDTRSRMKEVAVRKVHGAKRRDIILLFGRLYLWLIFFASVLSIPFIIMFNSLLKDLGRNAFIPSELISPVIPLIMSICLSSIVGIMVLGLHIYKVIKLQPADIIAKE